jgi:Putative adhesin
MTGTASPPARTGPTPGRRGPNLWLVVGLPILVVLLVIAGVLAVVLPAVLRGPVNQRYAVEAGSTVAVTLPDARLALGPSSDGRVHVQVSGWALGRPRITVRTEGGRTTVRGGCPRVAWLDACDIRLAIALPPTADVSVTGRNGDISARALQGSIAAETTNGSLDVRGSRGDLTLHSTNGAIQLTDTTSSVVRADTTNGEIALTFTDAPSSVVALSTNGAVTVTVPDTTAYAVVAHTTNGALDTSSIRTDPASGHRIEARTTNGSVEIRPSAG